MKTAGVIAIGCAVVLLAIVLNAMFWGLVLMTTLRVLHDNGVDVQPWGFWLCTFCGLVFSLVLSAIGSAARS